jgi:23S rRNA (cytosine1962-C5)-methyltransferase
VESSRKEYLGRAFVNPNSKIRARIFSPSKEGVDVGFFKRRIREALARRRGAYDLESESARIVFAEADFLPGLIVDRFVGWPLGDVGERPEFGSLKDRLGPPRSWLSVQFLTYGMDIRRGEILSALEETLSHPDPLSGRPLGAPSGIIERDEAHVRELEGLPLKSGVIAGSFPEEGALIFENGLPSPWTSWADRRPAIPGPEDEPGRGGLYARGRRVMDACCHTGGFGIHAARAGAEEVVFVDASAPALAAVSRNAALNGVADRVSAVEANVFDILRSYERAKEKFGLIVLDPRRSPSPDRPWRAPSEGTKRSICGRSTSGTGRRAGDLFLQPRHGGGALQEDGGRRGGGRGAAVAALGIPLPGQRPSHPGRVRRILVPEVRYLRGALIVKQKCPPAC